MDERQEDCWECGSENSRIFKISTARNTCGHIMECLDCDFKDIYLQHGDSAVVLADYSNGRRKTDA